MAESVQPRRLFWEVDLAAQKRADGSILVWQKGTLPDCPARMSDRIAHWAEQAPDRLWMAERGGAMAPGRV
ncbi:hypothetical protein [uncultured Roseovarius sp.]|uniref:hypothetical protein n=1 Tax=uncultured Roseovarius sp. TaxID=293344 RepID=UPI00343FE9DA